MGVCPQWGRLDPPDRVTEIMDRLMHAHVHTSL